MEKNSSLRQKVKVLEEIGKVRISIPVAFTTFTGYTASHGSIDRGIVLPTLGIFLLACAASAFNQVQEVETDRIMRRTHRRPIPSGRLRKMDASLIALAFAVAGTTVLFYGPGLLTTAVGLLTLAWYNLIYTPLKRLSAFAAVPGGMVGALPPVAGWVAGGGNLLDPGAFAIAFFFFMGQIPHFWLLLLKFGREYQSASLPSLTAIFSEPQIRRLTYVWIAATGISAFTLPLFRVLESGFATYASVILSVLLIFYFSKLLSRKQNFEVGRSFVLINIYYLFIMLIIIADQFIGALGV